MYSLANSASILIVVVSMLVSRMIEYQVSPVLVASKGRYGSALPHLLNPSKKRRLAVRHGLPHRRGVLSHWLKLLAADACPDLPRQAFSRFASQSRLLVCPLRSLSIFPLIESP